MTTSRRYPHLGLLAAAGAAAALLAACGGSDDVHVEPPPPAAAPTVPPGATVDSRAYATFVGSLSPDDRAEPLTLDGVVPPTSESEDPLPLT